MSLQLRIFQFEDADKLSSVRTVEINGEPWFVGKDVASILGYTNASKAITDHCKPKGITNRYPLETPGGIQAVTLINEANVFRLIVKSTLPSAEKFEDWLFEEVLPALRKKGEYKMGQAGTATALKVYTARILSEPTKAVPKDYWCIFDKCHSIFLLIEMYIGNESRYDLADGSIGKRWRDYRVGKPWVVECKKYPYVHADVRGIVYPFCYHVSELQYFDVWLKYTYRTQFLYTYLIDKYTREKNVAMLDKVATVLPKLLK